jgi:hypothetical protein
MNALRPFRSSTTALRVTLLTWVALAAGSCTTVVQRGADAGVVAQLSVERFLQAANARDVESMGRIFGTAEGPIMDTGSTFGCFFKKIGSWFGGDSCVKRRDVEVRLDAIARVLQHEDYRIVREEAVAGRIHRARRIFVDLTVGGERVADIPFVVVQAKEGRWLVEAVDLQRVMAGR